MAIGSSEIGGGQKVFLTYIKEYLKRGYSVDITLPAGPLAERIKAYDCPMHLIDLSSPLCLLAIAKIIRQGHYDIINTFLTKCSLLISLVNLWFRVPLCCTLLNAITRENLGMIQKRIYPLFYFLLNKMSRGIIVNSEQNKKHYIEVAKMNENTVEVIYSGIDVDEFLSRSGCEPSGDKYVIGAVGRLSDEKGHIYLLRALKHINDMDFECLIVGDGPLRSRLESYVRNEGLIEKVRFLGFQDHVAAIMSRMDIVVMPSLSETFGITIIEAFVLRKLVIASAVGGIPELVKNNITGFLYPAKDSLALAETIKYAYRHKFKVEQIVNSAFAFAMTSFTGAVMAENTLSYYDALCRRKQLPNQKTNERRGLR